VFHQGKIVDMKTGDGKPLKSVAAAYLNAISERGADWMRPIFSYLGIRHSVRHGVGFRELGIRAKQARTVGACGDRGDRLIETHR
jgi:preprotein translocase subunit SecA